MSPIDTAVISLCAMHAGNLAAMSVIPRDARLVGTVRTFRPQTQDAIERRLSELVHSIAAAFGASATLKYERAYPATINSEREAEFAAAVGICTGVTALPVLGALLREMDLLGHRIGHHAARRLDEDRRAVRRADRFLVRHTY